MVPRCQTLNSSTFRPSEKSATMHRTKSPGACGNRGSLAVELDQAATASIVPFETRNFSSSPRRNALRASSNSIPCSRQCVPNRAPVSVSGIKHSRHPTSHRPFGRHRRSPFPRTSGGPDPRRPGIPLRFPRALCWLIEVAPFAHGAGLFLDQVGQDPSAVFV